MCHYRSPDVDDVAPTPVLHHADCAGDAAPTCHAGRRPRPPAPAHRACEAPGSLTPLLLALLLLPACPAALSSAVTDAATPTAMPPPVAGDEAFAELEAQLAQHPLLASLRAGVDASLELATVAGALPDPEFSVGLNNFPILDPSFDEYLPSNRSLGVAQAIPNAGVRRARTAMESQRAVLGELAVAQTLDELRARLVAALIDRARVEEQRALARERDASYGELVEVIRTEIDAGRPVVFRLSQIDVERADVARELAELDGEAARIDAELVELVGHPATGVAPPSVSLASRSGDAGDFHAVRLAEARTGMADSAVEQARSEYGPDWRVSLTWQQREAGSGTPGSRFEGDDWITASLGFTLPLWRERRQAPDLRAARARRSAAHSETLAAARAGEARWAAQVATLEAAERSIAILSAKLAALDAQIAATLTNYEAGLGDYSQVIDAGIARLQLKSQLAGERARRARTIAAANALVVSP